MAFTPASSIKAAPFGYAFDADNVTLKSYEPEQEVLALVRALLSEGLTIARIAIELKRRELLTAYYLSLGQDGETGLALSENIEAVSR